MPTVSAYIVKGTALSTVAGLYVTYPAVLVASAKFGLVGASGASLVVGIASAVSTLIWSDNGKERISSAFLPVSCSIFPSRSDLLYNSCRQVVHVTVAVSQGSVCMDPPVPCRTGCNFNILCDYLDRERRCAR